VSVSFLQVTTEPKFVFRVFEKMVLRIKEPAAITALVLQPAPVVAATDPGDGAHDSPQPR
jgi:hypothetical protein